MNLGYMANKNISPCSAQNMNLGGIFNAQMLAKFLSVNVLRP